MVTTMTTGNTKVKSSRKVRGRLSSSSSSSSTICYKRLFIARPDVLHQYLRHQYVNQYLEYVKQRYPSFVEIYTLGSSYEGRPLKAIEIDWNSERNTHEVHEKSLSIARSRSAPSKVQQASATEKPNTTTTQTTTSSSLPSTTTTTATTTKTPPSRSLPKAKGDMRNLIFIEGGTHGREWLTVSVALHIIHQLTEKHIRNMQVLKRFRFFIVPISNPDGYEYTFNKNIRWRKNRRPTAPGGKHCGVDCNRNYDIHWDKGSTKISGGTYKGEKPFSECETRALSATLKMLSPNILLFISLHSYAQSIMYPWGFTREPAENMEELQTVALAGKQAIRAFSGRHYRTGSIVKLSSHVIGGSIVDYAYGVIKAPYAYVMELPDSSLGFQPPADVIRPIGEESWIGIREMCYCSQTLYCNRSSRSMILQKLGRKYGNTVAMPKHEYENSSAIHRTIMGMH